MENILIIDDNQTIREGIAAVVAKMGYKAHVAEDGHTGLKLFKSRRMDFIVTDLKMEGKDGMQVCKEILELDEDAVVMVITAYGTIETAVEVMKLGAFDFITKPFTPDVLEAKVEQALQLSKIKREHTRLKEENQLLRDEIHPPIQLENMVASSKPMRELVNTIHKVAVTDSTVLITGESGTGKELVARALHEASRRRKGPFIRVNCAALSETLLESEMFGHEKGAFTGAVRRKLGRFELADAGTILLDEIGEISPNLQLKLLRVLQEKEFERVGGEETQSVDVRVVACTNRDLGSLVKEGGFREDLYYRLHIVPLHIPPLRERSEEIADLTKHFIRKLKDRTHKDILDISDRALEVLNAYHWPGNVRELENIIEQSMVFADSKILDAKDLPSNLTVRSLDSELVRQEADGSLRIQATRAGLTQILEQVEKTIILDAFQRANRVKTTTARLLDVKTSALYYKLEKYGID